MRTPDGWRFETRVNRHEGHPPEHRSSGAPGPAGRSRSSQWLPMAHYNVALIHEERGQLSEAIRAYEEELTIAP